MRPNVYTYCLFQYRHAPVLEEVLNVGVLVYYHQSQQLSFLYPERLIRLRFAYPDLPEKIIKAYCKLFETTAKKLSATPEIFSRYDMEHSFSGFINQVLIPADSSSLQFNTPKKALQFDDSIDIVNTRLYNRYFGAFETDVDSPGRINETILLAKYKNLLHEFGVDKIASQHNKIFEEYTIYPASSSEIVFGFAWQNETLNLVKPVSFDLKRKDALERKAFYNYGRFLNLEEEAEKNNYRFDLLLAKPKAKELFKAYDKAIELLNKPRHVKLIEDKDFNAYTESTVKALFN